MSSTLKKTILVFSLLIAAVLGLSLTSVYSAQVYEQSGTTHVSSSDMLRIRVDELTFDATDSNGDGVADIASRMESAGSRVSISPCVTNTSDIECWVYLKVDTPLSVDGMTAYTYEPTDDWSLIEEMTENDRVKSVYAYKAPLAAGQSSPILFDEFYYASDVLNEDDNEAYFYGYAIQKSGVDDPIVGWQLYKDKHN